MPDFLPDPDSFNDFTENDDDTLKNTKEFNTE
jgi:hypothetical protein